jgi:ATP-dependent Clp protease ATP-binding subunit ClpA
MPATFGGAPTPESPERARGRAGTVVRVFERFTDRARATLVMAQEEARLLHHSFIGTEHILLGLLRQEDGIAGEVLTSFGVSLETARRRVQETVGAPIAGAQHAELASPPFTPRAKKVLELALREALQLDHNYIGTEHLLLGIIREGEGVGAQVLIDLKVDLASARQRVLQFISEHLDNDPSEGVERTSGATHFSRGATLSTGPRCPKCQAEVAQAARYRTIEVRPDAHDEDKDSVMTFVVYCTGCGISLHMFTK